MLLVLERSTLGSTEPRRAAHRDTFQASLSTQGS